MDPLGGSWYVEHLTNAMEARARDYFRRIADQGGVLACIENGFLVREIAEAAYAYQRQVEAGLRVTVGVDRRNEEERLHIPVLKVDREGERRQIARLEEVRRTRSAREVGRALRALTAAARTDANLMPPIIEAVKAYATLSEMMDALREVFGEYTAYPGA